MSVLGIWYAMFIDWIFRILIFAIHYRRHYT
jgi:Na+-driven multidrug efflux pump